MRSNSKKTACFVVAMFLAVCIVILYTKPVTNRGSAGSEARKLLAGVGGSSNVCNEADQVFKRFGVAKETFFDSSDLKAYPAIAALGGVCVIFPDNPPRLSIRIGNHRNGFFIDIPDTNSPAKYPVSSDTIELVKSRVFVHR
jgi:hypothetical protein